MTLALRPLTNALLGLLFPDRCASCNRTGELFCPACRARLRPYPAPTITLAEPDDGGAVVDAATVAFVFEGPLRAAIHSFKYKRVRRMAIPIGDMLAHHLRTHPLTTDAIVPVPLHPKRQAERGFNQSEVLAQQLTHACNIPIAAGLVRCQHTEQQARLSASERRENVRSAFVWQRKTPPPRRVLLLDDVLTTGATVSACAQALRQAGTQEVRVLALARSRSTR